MALLEAEVSLSFSACQSADPLRIALSNWLTERFGTDLFATPDWYPNRRSSSLTWQCTLVGPEEVTPRVWRQRG